MVILSPVGKHSISNVDVISRAFQYLNSGLFKTILFFSRCGMRSSKLVCGGLNLNRAHKRAPQDNSPVTSLLPLLSESLFYVELGGND